MKTVCFQNLFQKLGTVFISLCLLALNLETNSIQTVQAASPDLERENDSSILSDILTHGLSLSNHPAYAWHTFLGSSSAALSMTRDSGGNIYLTGESTSSWDGPGGVAPINAYTGGSEIVVVKLSKDGAYQWHTFFGSTNYDGAYSIAVDGSGNIYLAGWSEGDWNGPGGIAPLHAYFTGDLVVIKLNSHGAYQWHTFYGEGSADLIFGIALDETGNIYLTGYSTGTWNGPDGVAPLNPHTTENGDITILKLSNAGVYQWHTFYGSAGFDEGNGITVDENGNVYVAGTSEDSWNGPSDVAPLNPYSGNSSLTIIKLDDAGNYQWHTFYPSRGSDIITDFYGDVYVIGTSYMAWNGTGGTPPLNAYKAGSDILVLKLSDSGAYQWHTFYGSSLDYDMGVEIVQAGNGDIFSTAISNGAWNGPGDVGPINPYSGNWDITVLKLSSAGVYQSHAFYGSYSDDAGIGIVLDNLGNIYTAGYSYDAWSGPGGAVPLNAHTDSHNQNIMVMKMIDDTINYPTVITSRRADPNPISAAVVKFTVTFSESVTGVDTSDFVLFTTGVRGATIPNVSGSGTTYTVTVNTGTGNGTIRLDVVDDNSIKDGSNNPLGGMGTGNGNYTSGEAYTITTGADTTGVFRPSNGALYLKNKNETGFADVALNYGLGGDYPIVGDWDGDEKTTIGVYRNGSFYLRNSNTIGFADVVFPFGMPGDQPIAGDWNGDGVDTIGVYRPSTGQFLLRNSNSEGAAEISFYLGNVGDVAIAGDWDGDGFDTIGVFRPSNGIIFLKNTNTTGFADVALNYGIPGDKPVTGDWDNDGIDTIGVYRNGQFMLRNENTIGFADIVFGLGVPGDMPIAGNWDGQP